MRWRRKRIWALVDGFRYRDDPAVRAVERAAEKTRPARPARSIGGTVLGDALQRESDAIDPAVTPGYGEGQ